MADARVRVTKRETNNLEHNVTNILMIAYEVHKFIQLLFGGALDAVRQPLVIDYWKEVR